MRISTNPADPGYHVVASLCRVFLAGSERNNVITADEEGRFALVQRLDSDGRPIVKAGVLLTEQFFGDVRIECSEYVRERITQRT